jgi:hypothetical protein
MPPRWRGFSEASRRLRQCKRKELQVTEMTESVRADQASPQLVYLFTTTGGRVIIGAVCLFVVFAVAIGSYFAARISGDSELKSANLRIVQLQSDNQKLVADNTDQLGTIADLQLQVKNAQAKLAVILPTENTYNINPNQALLVANGLLTVGLVGSPRNESINLNINGKPQNAVVGTPINIAPDASTNCQVTVQSFDMFKAVITATCAAAKPQ